MIRRNTVFVVGAGASVPYGFPTGQQLLQSAVTGGVAAALRKASPACRGADIRNLHAAFNGAYLCESVDELLENRTDLQANGRLYLAGTLLEHETNAARKYHDNDWIRHLLALMRLDAQSPADFVDRNPVTFITYNYDRLLEHYLLTGLREQFKELASDQDIVSAFHRIPIHHLHGSLGSFKPTDPNWVPFGLDGKDPTLADEAYYRWAADSIHFVSTANPANAEFKQARDALARAEQVFFVGFGFGKTNVERLGLSNIPTGAFVRFTCFGMTPGEIRHRITDPLSFAKIGSFEGGNPTHSCLQLLREKVQELAA